MVIAGVLAGGKTTLLNTLFDQACKTAPGAEAVTKDLYSCTFTRNDVTIHAIDTPGLEGTKKKTMMKLRDISNHTDGRVYILVYCLPVNSSHRFLPNNPVIMKHLQGAYGKEIWQHCLLVFTRSNEALEFFKTEYESDAIEQYKRHIKEFAKLFQSELRQKLNVRDATVTTIFDENPQGIIAIPAGKVCDDPVLPGIESNWREVILDTMSRCNPDCAQTLQQYCHGMVVEERETADQAERTTRETQEEFDQEEA